MAGAAVGVVASTAVVTKLQSKRLDAGGVLLHNALVGMDDPTSLTRQEVVDIGQRYVCRTISVKHVLSVRHRSGSFCDMQCAAARNA